MSNLIDLTENGYFIKNQLSDISFIKSTLNVA